MRTRTGNANKATALMVVFALVVGILQLDPLGASEPLRETEVAGCDGRSVVIEGEKAELVRLHNEERAEHGAPALAPAGRADRRTALGCFSSGREG